MTGVYSSQTLSVLYNIERLRDVQMILITHTRARQQSTNQPAETNGIKERRPASYFCQFPVINEILNPARLLSRLVSVYYKQQCSGPGVTPTLKPESDPLLILLPDPCVGAESSVQTLLFGKILSLQRKHK